MKTTNIHTLFFSPTGTSEKTAAAVARGMSRNNGAAKDATPAADGTLNRRTGDENTAHTAAANNAAEAASLPEAGKEAKTGTETETGTLPVTAVDLTHTAGKPLTLPADTAAIFAVPVYGGHVAPVALERLQGIRGTGTPAVVLAVYGNRAFGTAAAELAAFVAQRGFVPVAAAAFVGEHSYSTPDTPIAPGRPDAGDIAAAEAFGAQVREKLAQDTLVPVDAAKLRAPRTPLLSQLRFIRFVLGYRKRQKRTPVVLLPKGDAGRCTQCGRCVAICPTQAITRGDELHTDPARCIRCCACVKGCTFGARTFETPFAAVLARNFARRKPPVTLL